MSIFIYIHSYTFIIFIYVDEVALIWTLWFRLLTRAFGPETFEGQDLDTRRRRANPGDKWFEESTMTLGLELPISLSMDWPAKLSLMYREHLCQSPFQAMTSIEDLEPSERKRQREALRRRLQQPGAMYLGFFFLIVTFSISAKWKSITIRLYQANF